MRSCECALACLCPHNSISNFVASVIHDNKCLQKCETIVVSDVHIVRKTWVLSSFSVSVSVSVSVCCVLCCCGAGGCGGGGGRRRGGGETYRNLGQSFFRDFLKDGEPCLSRANAGGGSWRY